MSNIHHQEQDRLDFLNIVILDCYLAVEGEARASQDCFVLAIEVYISLRLKTNHY